MKKLLKILLITFIVFVMGTFSIDIYAQESEADTYTLSLDEDNFVLYKHDKLVKRTSDIKEIFNLVGSSASLYFADITLDESLTINNKELTISGTLMLESGASLIIDGESVVARDLALTFDTGTLRIRRGSFSLYSGSIRSGGVAVSVDFSSLSRFDMHGGSIYSDGSCAVSLTNGGIEISGGYIECKNGYAIDNSASLTLSRKPIIKGEAYDIATSVAISLDGAAYSYEGSTRVKFLADFPLGEATPVFYTETERSLGGISLFDKYGEKMTLKFYNMGENSFSDSLGAVYRPFTISLKYKENVIGSAQYVKGSIPTLPEAPNRVGYTFLGWYNADGELYDSAVPINRDITLYARYKLTAPSFNLFYENFVYDGEYRYIRVENVAHPLLLDGYLSYEWYKNGEKLSSYGSSHRVKEVIDSGEYSVIISLTVGQDTVSVETPAILLNIEKASVLPPQIEEKSYTGSPITPKIEENSIYTAENISPIEAGVYSIKLTLIDKENYKFSGTDKDYIYVDFKIERAKNSWITKPKVEDIYTGEVLNPSAKAEFGEVRFLFSLADEISFTENKPNKSGEYLLRAVVLGTDNYEGLESEPITFKITEEIAVGISIKEKPKKVEYVAFEHLLTDGISVEVAYNSGRCELVDPSKLSFEYQMADSFRYGDVGVRVSYLGCSVMLPLSVSRANYDISGISFPNKEFVYDGTQKTIEVPKNLPIGLDNIPLMAYVTGGGIDAGEYIVNLHFTTESESYNIPKSLSARVKITPLSADVVWEKDNFVYDGSVKLPTAFFLDIYKRRVPLTVEGGRIYAGVYTASILYDGKNYVLNNTTTSFEIKKADYDMSEVKWVGGGYTYDGGEKLVTIENLPEGVEVIGYINNKARDAGEYVAVALFSYDEENYNPPKAIDYSWQIEKSEYERDGFEFLDNNVIYDGQLHYPKLSGTMPKGVDGITLEYSFSLGATHVSEGRVRVEISFKTSSRNYVAPPPVYAFVSIEAREIYVIWENLTLTYNAEVQAPSATAKETSVSVSTYGVNAGVYKTYATADNSDYKIINSECEFVIEKRENSFIKGPSANDIFYGREPDITAECLAGKIEVVYYSDKECKNELSSIPTAVGKYYLIVKSDGDNNHKPITSPVLSFEIIAVVPISLEGVVNREYFSALDKVTEKDISLLVGYNDGTKRAISLSEAKLGYERGDSFLYGDSFFIASYENFSLKILVDVRLAEYDLTNLLWKNTLQIYDGMEKSAYLDGVPEGIKITGYVGNSQILAGEYTVGVSFEYDEANYKKPNIPTATLVIARQVVDIPGIKSATYNGDIQMPELVSSPLYSIEFDFSPISSGVYPVKYTLVDKENYVFANGNSDLTLSYAIEKRVINIRVNPVTLYLLENRYNPSYTIVSGSLLSGDMLIPTYREENGELYVSFEGLRDYDIRVIPGRIERLNRLSPAMSLLMFVLIIISIILVLLLYLILKKRSNMYINSRGAIMHISDPVENPNEHRENGVEVIEAPSIQPECQINPGESISSESDEPTPPEEIIVTEEGAIPTECDDEPIPPEEIPIEPVGVPSVECDDDEPIPPEEIPISINDGISVEYADSAITNSIARDLLRRDEVIVTEGNTRGIINVDTLSHSFSAGDRVDINILKEHRLIPYDTSYIKVLARGVIDKPLTVYANDFSLSAIKMIVLSGGKAVRANTYSITKKGKST